MRWFAEWGLATLLLVTTTAGAQTPAPAPPYPPAYPHPPYPYPYAPYPYPYPYPYPAPYPAPQPQPAPPGYPQPAPPGHPQAPAEPPRVLKYNDGDPIPPGYRLVERPRQGLVVTGWILSGIGYGLVLMAGMSANFENHSGWLAVPFAGPWLTLGRRDYCDDPEPEGERTGECLADVFVVMGLIMDGIMQTAGGTLLLIGYMSPKRELVREYASVRLGPMRVGSGYGLGVTLF